MSTNTLPTIVHLTAVDAETFGLYLLDAFERSERVASSCSTFDIDTETPGTLYRLDRENRAGFAVRPDGELVYVFSLTRGLGDTLVRTAIRYGATHLDCFDGYLVDFYGRHGFVQYNRIGNWDPSGPDVVYMHRP